MTHHSSLASSTKYNTDLNLVSIHEFDEHTQDVSNMIARRAFEIFEGRGHVHGNEREDWFLAESELLTPVKIRISESGEQLIARAEALGFNREEIKVSLEPRRLSISAKSEPHGNHQSRKHTSLPGHAHLMLRVIDLPCDVDLSKAKATFNGDTLEVFMPKAAPAKSVRVETRAELPAEYESSIRNNGETETAGRPPAAAAGANEPIVHARASSRG
jgi:HSP20 family molecular chaperone IbpA